MNYRKQIAILILLALLLLLLGYYSGTTYPRELGLCNEMVNRGEIPANYCGHFDENFAQPLGLGGISLLIACLILLFISEETYKSWRKFAYWGIPVGAILLWLAPTSSPGGLGISFFNYTKE